MKLEHRPYYHLHNEHGHLWYLRTQGPLLVLGYHVNRGWRSLFEITFYPFKEKSLGKSWNLDTRLFGCRLRLGLGMSEILVGLRR